MMFFFFCCCCFFLFFPDFAKLSCGHSTKQDFCKAAAQVLVVCAFVIQIRTEGWYKCKRKRANSGHIFIIPRLSSQGFVVLGVFLGLFLGLLGPHRFLNSLICRDLPLSLPLLFMVCRHDNILYEYFQRCFLTEISTACLGWFSSVQIFNAARQLSHIEAA